MGELKNLKNDKKYTKIKTINRKEIYKNINLGVENGRNISKFGFRI